MSEIIIIPTYNERENVGNLVSDIRALNITCDILVVDDSSPDGTADVVRQMAKEDKSLFLLLRGTKEGIGAAHVAGLQFAYEKGYETIITMDCDFTHPPEYLPTFLKELESVDVVIGSRHLKKGSTKGWPVIRRATTLVANSLTKLALGLPYDATNAYRAYRTSAIPFSVFASVQAKGYAFFFESLYRVANSGARIKEIPVHLPARTLGSSKMNFQEIVKWGKFLSSLFWKRITGQWGAGASLFALTYRKA